MTSHSKDRKLQALRELEYLYGDDTLLDDYDEHHSQEASRRSTLKDSGIVGPHQNNYHQSHKNYQH